MTSNRVTFAQESDVYRAKVAYPGRHSQRRWTASTFVDVRLSRAEWNFLVAAVESFDATGHVDEIEREEFDELVDLLERHGRLARWSREER